MPLKYREGGVTYTAATIDGAIAAAWPIGSVYVQYPGKVDPSILGFPGAWTNISTEFAGDFFRAEGGGAVSFGGGRQGHQFQIHAHNHRHAIRQVQDAAAFQTTRVGLAQSNTYVNYYSDYTAANPSSGTSGTETRPVNQTIRIWERTS